MFQVQFPKTAHGVKVVSVKAEGDFVVVAVEKAVFTGYNAPIEEVWFTPTEAAEFAAAMVAASDEAQAPAVAK